MEFNLPPSSSHPSTSHRMGVKKKATFVLSKVDGSTDIGSATKLKGRRQKGWIRGGDRVFKGRVKGYIIMDQRTRKRQERVLEKTEVPKMRAQIWSISDQKWTPFCNGMRME